MRIEIPTHCPCCSYPLQFVNDQLFCRNNSCDAQLTKKLEHFAKTLGIKGLGPKTVAKLNLGDLPEIYYLNVQDLTDDLGSERIAQKLFDEIENSRSADLATVLAAFSIPLIGSTAAEKICSVVESVDEITEETCKQAGLGEKATTNLINWLDSEFKEVREFLPFSFTSKTKIDSGTTMQTVCITGKLSTFKTKAEASKALTEAGYRVVETVTKSLSFLVDEGGDGSTKRKKADSYNITIITNLTDFLKKA